MLSQLRTNQEVGKPLVQHFSDPVTSIISYIEITMAFPSWALFSPSMISQGFHTSNTVTTVKCAYTCPLFPIHRPASFLLPTLRLLWASLTLHLHPTLTTSPAAKPHADTSWTVHWDAPNLWPHGCQRRLWNTHPRVQCSSSNGLMLPMLFSARVKPSWHVLVDFVPVLFTPAQFLFSLVYLGAFELAFFSWQGCLSSPLA